MAYPGGAMKKEPLVSVVMPTYNSNEVIANAIMSIVGQTYERWELIIVDDGSDESSKRFLKAFVNNLSEKRIKLVEIEHSGVVAARMEGYRKAKGEIIAVQDADDLSMPDRLEVAVDAFKKDEDLGVFCHALYVNMWLPIGCIYREYRKNHFGDKRSLLREQTINGVPIFRKWVIEQCPLRDDETRDAYDWQMLLDWSFSGFKFKFEDRALYEYVRHSNSLSERNEKEGRRHTALLKIKQNMKEDYQMIFKPKDFTI